MQSIIVYRNPMEAAFWETMSGGEVFPILVGVVVFFAVFLTVQHQIVDRYYGWKTNGAATKVNLAISTAFGAFVSWYMLSKI